MPSPTHSSTTSRATMATTTSSNPNNSNNTPEANTFKFLLSTDNHLGFAERDPRRGDDSFTTFEEVLRAARTEHQVDALLLGGDLFHENKPSLGCLTRSCALFKTYVMGDRPVTMSLLSDPKKNFPTHAVPVANFQDPNVNIALPVFAIHGNHDDPVGGTSALDILASGSYINYFGHVSSLEEIVVEPILLRKGGTYVALYGLGNVRDDRLHRCFRMKKVHFIHPKPVEGRRWFNILLVHQNRGVRGRAARAPAAAAAAEPPIQNNPSSALNNQSTTSSSHTRGMGGGGGGSKAGIYEDMLAGFGMDLVIWGNEHEQYMTPQPSHGFDIIQPGSTVLTSISPQECNPKQYGVLEIRGTSYRLTPFMLRSVRPVVRRTVELRREIPQGRTLDAVECFLRQVVEDMIEEAEEQLRRVPDDVLQFHPQLKYPLMRLAVDFTDKESAPYPQPNMQRFGQQYTDVIANPADLLKPVKPKPLPPHHVLGTNTRSTRPGEKLEDEEVLEMLSRAPQLNTLDIRMKMAQVFRQSASDASCSLLSEPEVSAAVYAFAEKCERDAIDERLVELLNISQKHIWKQMENGNSDAILKPDAVLEAARNYKKQLNRRSARNMISELNEQEKDEEGDEEEEDKNGDEKGEAEKEEAKRKKKRLSDTFEHLVPPSAITAAGGAAPASTSTSSNPNPNINNNNNNYNNNNNNINSGLSFLQAFGTSTTPAGEWGNLTETAESKRKEKEKKHAEGREEEEEEEEELPDLPADGLDRSTMDHIIAEVVRQNASMNPLKTEMAPRPLSMIAVDVDEEDEGGAHHPNTQDAFSSSRKRGRTAKSSSHTNLPFQPYSPTPVTTTTTTTRSGRKAAHHTSTHNNNNSNNNNSSSGTAPRVGGGPSLLLTTTAMPSKTAVAAASSAKGATKANSNNNNNNNNAAIGGSVLNLLSKWGS